MVKKKWNKKKLLLLSLILLAIITLVITIMISSFSKTEKLPIYELKTLQEILEHYQCELVKKENSKEENIKFDIYVKFDKDYYTKDKSNKVYFTSLTSYISENLEYENYRLIDTRKKYQYCCLM